MKTKLIMVEGLPGFGKSTTAKLIFDFLTENQIKTQLYLEGNLDHPADYDGVACFTQTEFTNLLVQSGDLKELLRDRVYKEGNDYFLHYRKLLNEYGSKLPDSLLDMVFENDIYELPLQRHIPLLKNRWSKFAQQAHEEDKVYVFETCFIQNPLTIGMVKYGEEKEAVMNYVFSLEAIIKELNPVLVYVEQDNLEIAFRKAVKERPIEWSNGFIDYYTKQGYGHNHGYEGLEGTLKVLEARREVEREIVDKLKLKKLRVNNSHFDMANYKEIIAQKLNILSSE
jgi:hypothetical protein